MEVFLSHGELLFPEPCQASDAEYLLCHLASPAVQVGIMRVVSWAGQSQAGLGGAYPLLFLF